MTVTIQAAARGEPAYFNVIYQPRQQIIIRKQQNAAPISNPEAEHVKTRVAVEVLPQYNNNYNNN